MFNKFISILFVFLSLFGIAVACDDDEKVDHQCECETHVGEEAGSSAAGEEVPPEGGQSLGGEEPPAGGMSEPPPAGVDVPPEGGQSLGGEEPPPAGTEPVAGEQPPVSGVEAGAPAGGMSEPPPAGVDMPSGGVEPQPEGGTQAGTQIPG